MIPRTLEEWSIPIIKELLIKGYYESEYFDFKENLPHSKSDEDKTRLKKSCCAFANSNGGFLVFGITDNKSTPVKDRLVGIDPNIEFLEKFGNFPANCVSSVLWDFKNPPLQLSSGKEIHVIHIPRSWNAPHCFGGREEGWFFAKRTNKGNEGMSYEEVRLLFLGYYEKRVKLNLLISELENIINVANHMSGLSHEAYRANTRNLDTFDLTVINSVLVDTYTILSENSELIATISAIRHTCTALNNETQIFFQMLSPNFDEQQSILYEKHNDFIDGECQPLISRCFRAVEMLRKITNS